MSERHGKRRILGTVNQQCRRGHRCCGVLRPDSCALQRRVRRVDQRGGARVDQNAGVHFVRRIAESDPGLRVGEAERTASAGMAERLRIGAQLCARLRDRASLSLSKRRSHSPSITMSPAISFSAGSRTSSRSYKSLRAHAQATAIPIAMHEPFARALGHRARSISNYTGAQTGCWLIPGGSSVTSPQGASP